MLTNDEFKYFFLNLFIGELVVNQGVGREQKKCGLQWNQIGKNFVFSLILLRAEVVYYF